MNETRIYLELRAKRPALRRTTAWRYACVIADHQRGLPIHPADLISIQQLDL